MLLSNIKNLVKHSTIYSIGWAINSLASIILLPVYTRYLSKTDYGIIEICIHLDTVMRIVFLAGFNFAVAKFFHQYNDIETKKRVISTSIVAVTFISLIGFFVLFFFRSEISNIILGSVDYEKYIIITLMILVVDILYYIFLIRYLVEEKSSYFIALNFIKLIVGIATNLICIIYLKLGALGMLYGNLISYSVVAIISGLLSIKENGLNVDTKILIMMLRFGLPMIPANLLATIMHNADRYLIRYYCSLDDLGLYGLGYQFPWMLNILLLGSFNFIWSSATIYKIDKEEDSSYQYGKIATYFMTIFVFAQLALAILSSTIIHLLTTPKFYDAQKIIPLIGIGLCFHAFYTFFTTGAFTKSKTWVLILIYFPPALFNILANILLLPRFGYIAAAWTTVFTYFLFSLLSFLVCRRIINIRFEFGKLFCLFALAISTYIIYNLFEFSVSLTTMFLQICFLTVFVVTILLSKFFTIEEKNHIAKTYGHIINMLKTRCNY